jgi:hypothetical protein
MRWIKRAPLDVGFCEQVTGTLCKICTLTTDSVEEVAKPLRRYSLIRVREGRSASQVSLGGRGSVRLSNIIYLGKKTASLFQSGPLGHGLAG